MVVLRGFTDTTTFDYMPSLKRTLKNDRLFIKLGEAEATKRAKLGVRPGEDTGRG